MTSLISPVAQPCINEPGEGDEGQPDRIGHSQNVSQGSVPAQAEPANHNKERGRN